MASIFVTWGVTSTGLELSTDSMYISSGGTAIDTVAYFSGFFDVYSGGVINGAVISSGYLAIHSSGTANFTTIEDGGSMYISSGASRVRLPFSSRSSIFIQFFFIRRP